ncbi:hypothetical protein BX600DRAFT_314490 [Xylariales sp. PMI_506]|nr:hypothetical protein BX600DRAFT_314490 [Xylariales sp. PMI_506]
MSRSNKKPESPHHRSSKHDSNASNCYSDGNPESEQITPPISELYLHEQQASGGYSVVAQNSLMSPYNSGYSNVEYHAGFNTSNSYGGPQPQLSQYAEEASADISTIAGQYLNSASSPDTFETPHPWGLALGDSFTPDLSNRNMVPIDYSVDTEVNAMAADQGYTHSPEHCSHEGEEYRDFDESQPDKSSKMEGGPGQSFSSIQTCLSADSGDDLAERQKKYKGNSDKREIEGMIQSTAIISSESRTEREKRLKDVFRDTEKVSWSSKKSSHAKSRKEGKSRSSKSRPL